MSLPYLITVLTEVGVMHVITLGVLIWAASKLYHLFAGPGLSDEERFDQRRMEDDFWFDNIDDPF